MSPDESDIMTCKTLQDHMSTWSKDGQELKLSGMREPQLVSCRRAAYHDMQHLARPRME